MVSPTIHCSLQGGFIMIITLKQNAAETEVSRLRSELEEKRRFIIHPVEGARYNILGLNRRHCIPRCSPNRVPKFRR